MPELLCERVTPAAAPDGPSAERIPKWRRSTSGLAVFLPAFALYFAAGAVLVFHYGSIANDAIARVGNAFYVLYSRDPHLAAVGFVWNPLPSFAELPLLLLRGVIPAMSERAFAANIMSAAFMAGAVWALRATLLDLRVGRKVAIALTTLFALQPMVLYYGANGMSEAPFIFFLLVAARSFLRWLETSELRSLIALGFTLALAYLTRYEAVLAGAAAVALVAVVTFVRTGGDRRTRLEAAAADASIAGTPFIVTVFGWAAASWIIVGHPFEQFSSVYGNASQLRLMGAVAPWRDVGRPRYVLEQILGMQPVLVLLAVLALWVLARRREVRVLVPLALIGSAMAFQVLAFVTGRTIGFLRYSILAIPLAALLASVCLARVQTRPEKRRWIPRGTSSLLLLAAFAVGIPAGALQMTDRRLAPEEWSQLKAAIRPSRATAEQRYLITRYRNFRDIATYLDGLHLRDGAVLLDTYRAAPIVLASRRPRQFVVTSDRDFRQAVADPPLFDVQYLLVAPEGGIGELDALTRAHPGLYSTGAGMATLHKEFKEWRLYRVDAPPAVR